MTISELRDYLAKYTGDGKGEAPVLVCRMSDNPLEVGKEIMDIVFMEWQGGDCSIVLQIGGFKDGK